MPRGQRSKSRGRVLTSDGDHNIEVFHLDDIGYDGPDDGRKWGMSCGFCNQSHYHETYHQAIAQAKEHVRRHDRG